MPVRSSAVKTAPALPLTPPSPHPSQGLKLRADRRIKPAETHFLCADPCPPVPASTTAEPLLRRNAAPLVLRPRTPTSAAPRLGSLRLPWIDRRAVPPASSSLAGSPREVDILPLSRRAAVPSPPGRPPPPLLCVQGSLLRIPITGLPLLTAKSIVRHCWCLTLTLGCWPQCAATGFPRPHHQFLPAATSIFVSTVAMVCTELSTLLCFSVPMPPILTIVLFYYCINDKTGIKRRQPGLQRIMATTLKNHVNP